MSFLGFISGKRISFPGKWAKTFKNPGPLTSTQNHAQFACLLALTQASSSFESATSPSPTTTPKRRGILLRLRCTTVTLARAGASRWRWRANGDARQGRPRGRLRGPGRGHRRRVPRRPSAMRRFTGKHSRGRGMPDMIFVDFFTRP